MRYANQVFVILWFMPKFGDIWVLDSFHSPMSDILWDGDGWVRIVDTLI